MIKETTIIAIALTCELIDRELSASELADILNRMGILTNDGNPYCGERGTFTLARAIYHRVKNTEPGKASAIAGMLIDQRGKYAWEG